APLVIRFGAFGDMVLLTVLLRHLQVRFGRPVDVVSSGPWTRPLLQGHSSVARLFVIRSRRMPFWMSLDQRRLVAWLRARGRGPTWYCDMHQAGRDLLSRAGLPDEYICDSRAYPWQPGESFADRYIRLGNELPAAFAGQVAPLPAGTTPRAAQIEVSAQYRAHADQWLARRGLQGRPFAIVHPGSRHIARRGLRPRAGADKYWPESRWGEVVRAIREHFPDQAVLLSGTPKEYSLNEDIVRCARVADVHNVADDLPIPTLLPLLERAKSMISVDTGPAHAAAALGCPTVSLFGTANAALFRPGGATTRAVALTGTVDGVQNIFGITVQSVVAAWLDLVGSPQGSRQILSSA
ncbi:MAG TPA: glycosyltransferase family 9 protein, partial [Steroidobacteraceae bacterium]|nr:glycosyltransferase family 9 protein [Steroidobacteraceae bacterium]